MRKLTEALIMATFSLCFTGLLVIAYSLSYN